MIKLIDVLRSAVLYPKSDFRSQFRDINWEEYTDLDMIDLIPFWIGRVEFRNPGGDMIDFKNVNTGKFHVFQNLAPGIKDNGDYILYVTELEVLAADELIKPIVWANPSFGPGTHAGAKMLSHLFCLWYNGNLPLSSCILTRKQMKLKNQKMKQMEMLFDKMNYREGNWPKAGDKSWLNKFETFNPILKFE